MTAKKSTTLAVGKQVGQVNPDSGKVNEPQPKQETKPAVATEQPKQETTSAAPTQPAVPSKQQTTLDKLRAAWIARGVDVSKLTYVADGKNLMVTVGPGWPVIRLGNGGGIELPAIRSYARAFDAAVDGDRLLAKQNARDQKKAAPSATTGTAKPAEPAPPQATPAQKKAKQHEQIEKALA